MGLIEALNHWRGTVPAEAVAFGLLCVVAVATLWVTWLYEKRQAKLRKVRAALLQLRTLSIRQMARLRRPM